MEKMAWDGPKWDQEVLSPANPDLADILDDMDLDIDNFDFCDFFGFQTSGWQGSQISKIWPEPGRVWAGPGLSHLDQNMLIFCYEYLCLSSRPAVSCRRDESKCHQVCNFLDQNECPSSGS